jgi:hypothetical protein
MKMQIRKKDTRKFPISIDGDKTKYYFELRTLGRTVRDKAVSEALTQKFNSGSAKSSKSNETIVIESKIRSEIISEAEIKASLIGFVLPKEGGGQVSSEKMSVDQMYDELDMADEDLGFYVEQAVDIMQGNSPSANVLDRLAKMGVTPEDLGIAAVEGLEEVGNPTPDGKSV